MPLLLAATMLTDRVVLTKDDTEKIYYQACYNPSIPSMENALKAIP